MITGDRPSAQTVLQKLEQQKAEIERELNDRRRPIGLARSSHLRRQLEDIKKVLPSPEFAVMA